MKEETGWRRHGSIGRAPS